LRKQARENLKAHVLDGLPSDYEKCIVGMNEVLKQAWDIANSSKGVTNGNGKLYELFDIKSKLNLPFFTKQPPQQQQPKPPHKKGLEI
jgi:hypothetical protein